MTLHYIYDTLCAWCYGIDPHIRAAENAKKVEIILHAAGMYPLPHPFPNPDGDPVANFLAEAKQRHPQVERDTGMPISDQFQASVRNVKGLTSIDSRPATTAVLVAEKVQRDGLGMLRELQRSFFAHAESILDKDSVSRIARRQGLRTEVFDKEYDAIANGKVERHIAQTRKLVDKVGSDGYPTLVLEDDNGKLRLIEVTRFDNPRGWASRLR